MICKYKRGDNCYNWDRTPLKCKPDEECGKDMISTFDDLKGMTLSKILYAEEGSDEVLLYTTNGRVFKLYHDQCCCEHVELLDICGDIEDLLNSEILLAEHVTEDGDSDDHYDSSTWSFYKLATIKGSVTLRWFGTSNGYYSETVDFEEISLKEE